ncbi:hypothetical protein QJQ45_024339 [Haematococcus lacustris]|nr:hypothetical protein QJQ45_024339 [Haematococcus lacustris]
MQPRTAILPAALLIVALVAGAVSPSHAADVATSTLSFATFGQAAGSERNTGRIGVSMAERAVDGWMVWVATSRGLCCCRSLLGSGMKTPETSVSFSIELFKAATSALGSSFKLEGSTIFAPTDKASAGRAFQDLAATLKLTNPKPADLLTPALKDTSVSILKFHVVPGKVIMAKDIPSGSTVVPTALEGKSLTVTKAASGVMINGPGNSAAGKVIKTDIKFGTNIVHVAASEGGSSVRPIQGQAEDALIALIGVADWKYLQSNMVFRVERVVFVSSFLFHNNKKQH